MVSKWLFSHEQIFSTAKKSFSILGPSKYDFFSLEQNFLSGTKKYFVPDNFDFVRAEGRGKTIICILANSSFFLISFTAQDICVFAKGCHFFFWDCMRSRSKKTLMGHLIRIVLQRMWQMFISDSVIIFKWQDYKFLTSLKEFNIIPAKRAERAQSAFTKDRLKKMSHTRTSHAKKYVPHWSFWSSI